MNKLSKKHRDITGERFGWLVARELTGARRGASMWRCECECGGESIASMSNLTTGKTKSCGCRRTKDMTGKSFGRVTVVKYAHGGKEGAHWHCKCDCGSEFVARGRALRQGNYVSCGCSKTLPGDLAIVRSQMWYYVSNARKKEIEFLLSEVEFSNLIKMPCHYCGTNPDPVAGVDRVDNEFGYTQENCVPCCKDCNFAKNKLTKSDFLAMVKRIYENLCLENIPMDDRQEVWVEAHNSI